MMEPTPRDRAYLLGRLTADEAARLEVEVMEDAGVAERMEAAEAELIDDFVEGRLVADDRRSFETVFLATPIRRDRVRIARELATRSAGAPRASVSVRKAPTPLRFVLPLAAAIVAGVGLSLFMQDDSGTKTANTNPTPTPIPVPSATPANPTETPKPPMLRRATFALALAMARGSEATQLVVPKDAELIELQFDLDGETRYRAFNARLVDATGKELWRSDAAGVPASKDGVLTFELPPSPAIVNAGACELTVEGHDSAGRTARVGQIPVFFGKR